MDVSISYVRLSCCIAECGACVFVCVCVGAVLYGVCVCVPLGTSISHMLMCGSE